MVEIKLSNKWKAIVSLFLFLFGYGVNEIVDIQGDIVSLKVEGRQGIFECRMIDGSLDPYSVCTQGNATVYAGELLIEPEMRRID